MTKYYSFIAYYTIVRRELVRMFRIGSQVFIPPVISSLIYFLIFSTVVGSRLNNILPMDYTHFITPGLIMMAIIINSYGNVSSSLFSVRFQRSIEEMLVSPMGNNILLFGYITGGILRGILVAFFVYAVSYIFGVTHIEHFGLSVILIILVSAIFSFAGFINAMLAKTFDDIMIVPTFILSPLSYLGGIFYMSSMLPNFWQWILHLNPIFYMINLLRYAIIGYSEADVYLSASVVIGLLLLLWCVTYILLKQDVGLRD